MEGEAHDSDQHGVRRSLEDQEGRIKCLFTNTCGEPEEQSWLDLR